MSYLFFIDDDESTNFFHQIIVNRYLSDNKNIVVKFFMDAREALEKLNQLGAKNQPCYIFLDLNMPIMNGWEFLNAYNDYSVNHSSVIILTTSLNPTHKSESEKYPFVKEFLGKPLTSEYLESLAIA